MRGNAWKNITEPSTLVRTRACGSQRLIRCIQGQYLDACFRLGKSGSVIGLQKTVRDGAEVVLNERRMSRREGVARHAT